MKKIFHILIILFSIKTFSQAGPPAAAYPTEQNIILIDKLVEITEFKKYIQRYVFDRIDLAARLEKWESSKKDAIKQSFRIDRMDEAIYNSFSNYSTSELQNLVECFKTIDPKRKSNLVPMPFILQVRVDGYAKTLIKGDHLYLNEKK